MKRREPSALELAFDDAFTRFLDDSFETLAERDRILVAIWWLEGDVNNGGFGQYFRNSSGDQAWFAPQALRRIGAEKMTAIVEEANAEFGPGGPPRDRDERQERLLAMTGAQRARLDALDRRFCDYPDDLSRLLCAFLGLPPEER
jgi:hypothetical protein